MKSTFRLGTFQGVAVGANWSVLVTALLVAYILAVSVLPTAAPAASATVRWAAALVAAVLFLTSLAVHECAHALVARRHGVRVDSVTLWILGGVAELGDEPPTARADLRIAAVGPMASGAVAAFFAAAWAAAGVLGAPPAVVAPLAWLTLMNVAIAIFNLLPGAPLDGGRILRALLWHRRGDRVSAARTADRAGLVLGRAMIGGGVVALLFFGRFDGLWLALVGWFLTASARAESRWTDLREAVAGRSVADIMTRHPDHGMTWQPAGAFIDTVATASRRTVFPVVGTGGRFAGLVTAERLARLPGRDPGVTLDTIIVPPDPGRVVGPDEPAAAVLSHPPYMKDLVAVVVSGGLLVGTVTADDVRSLARAAERA